MFRFLRFAIVGGLCFAAGLASVWLLTEQLHWHYLVSAAVSMLAVNLLGWLLNRRWTFRLHAERSWQEFARYVLVNTAGFGVTLLLMALLVSGVGLNYLLACAVVGIVMAFVNFVAHGRWSLRARNGGG